MKVGKRYFEKREKLIELLNRCKDENGISKITRAELEKELGVNTSCLNQTIREINEDNTVIEKAGNYYKVNATGLFEIEKYKEMSRIITLLLSEPKLMDEDENIVAQSLNIKRTRLQKIKTLIRCF